MKQVLPSTNPFKKELARKALHLPVLAVPFLARVDSSVTLILMMLMILGYGLLALLQFRFSIRVRTLSTILDYCSRNKIFDPAPILMATGMIVSVYLAGPNQSLFPAFVLAICDSVSALVGKRYGRRSIFKLSKTWEGSLAFFLVCLLGACGYFSGLEILIVTLSLTVIEALGVRGLDNVLLPIAAQFFLMTY